MMYEILNDFLIEEIHWRSSMWLLERVQSMVPCL